MTSKVTYKYKRKYELVVFIITTVVSLIISTRIGNFIVLGWVLGYANVMKSGVDIVAMPHGKPWSLSDGQLLQTDVTGMWFGVVGFLWLAFSSTIYILIDRWFWSKGLKSGGQGGQIKDGKTCEISAVKGGFILLAYIIWFLGCFFLLGVSQKYFNTIAFIVLIIFWSVGLYYLYVKYAARRVIKLITTTACPACGALPMQYVERDKAEVLPRLVCNKCGVEIKVRV